MYNLRIEDAVYYDYFMYNGKKYPLNTAFVPTKEFKYKFKLPRNEMLVVGHGFHNYTKKEFYIIVYKHNTFNEPQYRKVYTSPDEWIQEIRKSINPNKKHYVYYKDKDVDEVVYGWIIYVASMLLLSIFNGGVVGWIFLSIYFFKWRKNKLRKEKKYDY